MSSILVPPEGDDANGGMGRNNQQPRIPTNDIASKLQEAIGNVIKVVIPSSSSEISVSLSLPSQVAEMARGDLAAEAGLSVSPANLERLRRHGLSFCEWSQTDLRHAPNHDDFALLYWVLEHFSEIHTLTNNQLEDLAQMTYRVEYPQVYIGASFGRSANSGALEYCLYRLVRLLNIEQKLDGGDKKTLWTAQHRDLLHNHLLLVLFAIDNLHERGDICVDDPKACIESKLLELGNSNKSLRPYIANLLYIWQEWREEYDNFKRAQYDRYDARLSEQGYRADPAPDIPMEVNQRKDLRRKLSLLENAMIPETNDAQHAWDYPLQYLEKITKGRRVVMHCPTSLNRYEEGDFSNGQKFAFAFCERLADQGFRSWFFMDHAGERLSLMRWFKQHGGDSRSHQSLNTLLNDYMGIQRGQRVPSLRDFLSLPPADESLEVSQAVRFFEELWSVKERSHARLHLLHLGYLGPGRTRAVHQLLKDHDEPLLFVGYFGGDIESAIVEGVNRNAVALIMQSTTTSQYFWDYNNKFGMTDAARYVTHAIGKNRGWGVHQSSAVPIRGNTKIMELVSPGRGGGGQDMQLPPGMIRLETPGEDYFDAYVFSAGRDEEKTAYTDEPLSVDTGARRPRRPVMSGDGR